VNENRGNLAGRRFLLTGAASGIAEATAAYLARHGALLALLDVDGHRLEQVADSIGPAAMPLVADVVDEDAVERAIRSGAGSLGGLDGLINCAGVVGHGAIADMPYAHWRRIIDVNLTGSYLVSRAAIPWIRKASNGSIVNVASNQALRPEAGLGAYAASKAGVVALTRSMAAELAPAVRVNCVCPGTIDTPMTRSVLPDGAPISNNAMGRQGSSDEVAAAIAFLLGEEAGFITGSTIAVDGGRTFY